MEIPIVSSWGARVIRPCGRRGCAKGMKGRRREVVKVGNYRGRCWFMMLNNNLFASGRVFIKVAIALAMFLGRDNVLLSFMSLSALLCEKSSCSVSRWTRNTVDQILIEGDAMYAKTFEQQSIPDTETLPLTLSTKSSCLAEYSTKSIAHWIKQRNKSIAHCRWSKPIQQSAFWDTNKLPVVYEGAQYRV